MNPWLHPSPTASVTPFQDDCKKDHLLSDNRKKLDNFLMLYDEKKFGVVSVIEQMIAEYSLRCCRPTKDSLGVGNTVKNVFNRERFKFVSKIHITASRLRSFTMIENLKQTPHYTLNVERLQSLVMFCGDITEFCFNLPGDASPGLQEPLSFVNVWDKESNIHPKQKDLEAILEKSDFIMNDLASIIAIYGKGDKLRGNKYWDFGFASNNNTARSKESKGISVPRVLSLDGIPEEGRKNIFEACRFLSRAAKDCLPLSYQRQRQESIFGRELCAFARSIVPESMFHAYRFAIVPICEGYKIHEDVHNHGSEGWGWVAIYHKIVDIENLRYRLSVIGYSRASLFDLCKRYTVYGPIVKTMERFFTTEKDFRLVGACEKLEQCKGYLTEVWPELGNGNWTIHCRQITDAVEHVLSISKGFGSALIWQWCRIGKTGLSLVTRRLDSTDIVQNFSFWKQIATTPNEARLPASFLFKAVESLHDLGPQTTFARGSAVAISKPADFSQKTCRICGEDICRKPAEFLPRQAKKHFPAKRTAGAPTKSPVRIIVGLSLLCCDCRKRSKAGRRPEALNVVYRPTCFYKL